MTIFAAAGRRDVRQKGALLKRFYGVMHQDVSSKTTGTTAGGAAESGGSLRLDRGELWVALDQRRQVGHCRH